VHVNQYLKYLKLGFGKVTQQVGVRIRYGIISRDEGKKIIQKYDGLVSEDLIERFCEYLEISKKEFIQIAERHRNHDFWFVNNDGEWVLKNPV
jgi:hypothetical protein